jgi:hypothetical protein
MNRRFKLPPSWQNVLSQQAGADTGTGHHTRELLVSRDRDRVEIRDHDPDWDLRGSGDGALNEESSRSTGRSAAKTKGQEQQEYESWIYLTQVGRLVCDRDLRSANLDLATLSNKMHLCQMNW